MSEPLRCDNTGNPCGTDTWPKLWGCSCGSCKEWLRSQGPSTTEGQREDAARALAERRMLAQSILSAADHAEAHSVRPGLDAVEEAEVIHEDQMDAILPLLDAALREARRQGEEAGREQGHTKRQAIIDDLAHQLIGHLGCAARLEAAEERARTAGDALRGAIKLPRPWMDGGVTWPEWEAALAAVIRALESNHARSAQEPGEPTK